MKTNSFSNFQKLFYELVESNNNLAPFYHKVNGFAVYRKNKDTLVLTFDYLDITGIHRYGKVELYGFSFDGDVNTNVESAAMAFTYKLSQAYPGFVCWFLNDAIKAAFEYYKDKAIPDSVEREWLGVANDTVFSVGIMKQGSGKFLVVSCEDMDYFELFSLKEGENYDADAIAEDVIETVF